MRITSSHTNKLVYPPELAVKYFIYAIYTGNPFPDNFSHLPPTTLQWIFEIDIASSLQHAQDDMGDK